MHGTLWNAIFTSLIGYEIDVIDTVRFNDDTDFLYRLATALGMRPNHEYWCKCTWRTNGINKTATSDRRPPLTVGLPVTSERYWVSFQVTRLFHKVTVLQCDNFLLPHMYLFETSPGWLQDWRGFLYRRFGGGALSSNVFTICAVYCYLGRRGYFGVSNVALVSIYLQPLVAYELMKYQRGHTWQATAKMVQPCIFLTKSHECTVNRAISSRNFSNHYIIPFFVCQLQPVIFGGEW